MGERATPGRRRERRGRLSRSAEFERVYRNGRSHGNRYLVLYAFPSEEAPASDSGAPAEQETRRLGVSVSRKVGGAVERNRVKRLLREAFWAESDRVADDHDYVIVARPDARELGDRDGLEGIRRELSELMDKLGNGSVGEATGQAEGAGAGGASASVSPVGDAAGEQPLEDEQRRPDDPPEVAG